MVSKKLDITIVKNKEGELIATRTISNWQVYIDYRKLNSVTRKDHFSLSFIDQILEQLAKQSFFYFLDGYSSYNQISIFPDDQEKITFTYPFGTFTALHALLQQEEWPRNPQEERPRSHARDGAQPMRRDLLSMGTQLQET